jgi:hypothetical protein
VDVLSDPIFHFSFTFQIGTNFSCYYDRNVDMEQNLQAQDIMSVRQANPIPFLIAAVVFYAVMLVLVIIALYMIASIINEKRARVSARNARQAAAASAPVVSVVVNAQPIAVIPSPQVPVHPSHPQPVPVSLAIIDLKKLDMEASMSMNADDICSICFAHRICVAMRPCNHTYTCRTCGSFFVNRPCGLCRQLVTSIESIADEAGSDSEDDNVIEMVAVVPSNDAQKANDVPSTF